jgi:hypothetical protein
MNTIPEKRKTEIGSPTLLNNKKIGTIIGRQTTIEGIILARIS